MIKFFIAWVVLRWLFPPIWFYCARSIINTFFNCTPLRRFLTFGCFLNRSCFVKIFLVFARSSCSCIQIFLVFLLTICGRLIFSWLWLLSSRLDRSCLLHLNFSTLEKLAALSAPYDKHGLRNGPTNRMDRITDGFLTKRDVIQLQLLARGFILQEHRVDLVKLQIALQI